MNLKSAGKLSKDGWLSRNILTFFSSDRIFLISLVFLLFIPLFFHGPHFGVPYVKGGDEPHYLVMINSLLIDGDLDLQNNYESARKGSWQVGKKYAGQAVDPHMGWNVGGKHVFWPEVYEDTNNWKKDADGVYIPERKLDATINITGLPGYSIHPAGIAFLLAPFLWPFRGTPYTEPLALLFSNLAVILSAFLFRQILQRYTKDMLAINLGTFLTFLGLPLWAYGRTLFMEPFLLFFAVGTFYLVLEKKSGFWAGMALGLGALLKPNFLILFFPLALFYAEDKKIKTILWMMVGPSLSAAATFYTNAQWYGSPFTSAQPFHLGNIFQGVLGLLFSWNHGIIPFAPVVLLVVLFWKRFISEHQSEALLLGGGFLIYFLMMSLWENWGGGWCYGPRLVSPVLAFLMIPIFYLPGAFSTWSKSLRWFALALCLLSLAFNLLGAMDGYWSSHPLTILKSNIS